MMKYRKISAKLKECKGWRMKKKCPEGDAFGTKCKKKNTKLDRIKSFRGTAQRTKHKEQSGRMEDGWSNGAMKESIKEEIKTSNCQGPIAKQWGMTNDD